MSLILEALKKLDRERQVPERGFLVVAHAPWPGRGSGRRALGLALLALVLALSGLALGLLRARRGTAPEALPRSAGARPVVPAPAPTAPPPHPAARGETPVRPRATPAPERPAPRSFLLQAISQRDGAPVAVLNDRLVREGDVFDGVRIIRIGATEVDIEVDGVRQVVRF